jgi:hypothetical protein
MAGKKPAIRAIVPSSARSTSISQDGGRRWPAFPRPRTACAALLRRGSPSGTHACSLPCRRAGSGSASRASDPAPSSPCLMTSSNASGCGPSPGRVTAPGCHGRAGCALPSLRFWQCRLELLVVNAYQPILLVMDEVQQSFLDVASDSLQSGEHSLHEKNHSRDRPSLEIMSQVPAARCERDTPPWRYGPP